MPVPVPLLKRVEADRRRRSLAAPRSRSAPSPSTARSPPRCSRRTGQDGPCQSWEDACGSSREYFLLQPHPHSFDSRYFGAVLRCDILGIGRRGRSGRGIRMVELAFGAWCGSEIGRARGLVRVSELGAHLAYSSFCVADCAGPNHAARQAVPIEINGPEEQRLERKIKALALQDA